MSGSGQKLLGYPGALQWAVLASWHVPCSFLALHVSTQRFLQKRQQRKVPQAHAADVLGAYEARARAGNFYTLVTGANERRWDKIRPRLEEIAKSFTVVDRFAAN